MIVVTCMGRLRHLKQTLPAMLEQDRVVVVDWSCPDKTARWVRGLGDPRVRVVQVQQKQSFHKTAALNLGAREAMRGDLVIDWQPIRNNWLLFLDADTKITDPTAFRSWHEQAMLERDHFHICLRPPGYRPPWLLTGVLLCSFAHFQQTSGFDKELRGWGTEDIEMRLRLAIKYKIPWKPIPPGFLSSIEHSDALRTRFGHLQDKELSNAKNFRHMMHSVQRWTQKPWRELDRHYRPLLSMVEPLVP